MGFPRSCLRRKKYVVRGGFGGAWGRGVVYTQLHTTLYTNYFFINKIRFRNINKYE